MNYTLPCTFDPFRHNKWKFAPVMNVCIDLDPNLVSVLKNIPRLGAVEDHLYQNTVPNVLNRNHLSTIMAPKDCKMLSNQLLEFYYEK